MNKKADTREIVLKKDSALISINSCSLTTMQRKIINTFFYIVKDYFDNSKVDELSKKDHYNLTFTTDLMHLCKVCGIKKNDKSYIKKSIEDLQSKVVEYNLTGKNKQTWGVFPIVAGVEIVYQVDTGDIRVEFGLPFQILRVILNPETYAYIDLSIVKGLNNKYSIALYEIARDYFKINSKQFAVMDLKKILGAGNKYKYFSMFEKRVLIPAIDDVNAKTEFNIEHEVIKQGRKKEFIRLHFKTKKPLLETKYSEKEENDDEIKKLKTYNIGKNIARKRINEYGLEAVRNAIDYTDLQIKNDNILTTPAQCFNFALKEELAGKTQYEIDKDQKEKEKNEVKKVESIYDVFKSKYEDHKRQAKNEIKKLINETSEEERASLESDYVSSLNEYDKKAFDKRNGFEHESNMAGFRNFVGKKKEIILSTVDYCEKIGWTGRLSKTDLQMVEL
ncbi:MAG: replication initiation protein [Nitrospinae bacterium]|nr:replication initiation protein [Nitrospinota bacterium]